MDINLKRRYAEILLEMSEDYLADRTSWDVYVSQLTGVVGVLETFEDYETRPQPEPSTEHHAVSLCFPLGEQSQAPGHERPTV